MIITNHALDRFKQRFYFKYNRAVFEPSRSRYFVKDLFTKSKPIDRMLRTVNVPVYNAICSASAGRTSDYCVGGLRFNKHENMVFVWKNNIYGQKVVITILTDDMHVGGYPISMFS